VEVEAVEVHHLGPGSDEGVDELLFGVGGGVDLGRVAHPFGVPSRNGGVSLAVASDRSLRFSHSRLSTRKAVALSRDTPPFAQVRQRMGHPASCQFPSLGVEVEAVEVHHLGPGGDEGVDELLLGVGGGVDLGEGAQLRIRPEDEVDAGGCPLRRA